MVLFYEKRLLAEHPALSVGIIRQAAHCLILSEVPFQSAEWSEYWACAGKLARCRHIDLVENERMGWTKPLTNTDDSHTDNPAIWELGLKSQPADFNWKDLAGSISVFRPLCRGTLVYREIVPSLP